MVKVNVLRRGCYAGPKKTELPTGEQEVSEDIASWLCGNKYAIAIEEAKQVESKTKSKSK